MRCQSLRPATGLVLCIVALGFGPAGRGVASHEATRSPTPTSVAVDFGVATRSTGRFAATIDERNSAGRQHSGRIYATVMNTGDVTSPAACAVSEVDANGTALWTSSLETPPIPPGSTARFMGVDPDLDPSPRHRYRISCS